MNERASGEDGTPGHDHRWRETHDLYELLEVSPHASQQVIRAAYRALARSYHPDTSVSEIGLVGQRQIRRLNAAYEILKDAGRRAEYDLECARMRRRDWSTTPVHARTARLERGSQTARSGPMPPRVVEPHADDRFPPMRAGALVVAMLAAALIVFTCVLMLSAGDTSEPTPPHALTQSIGQFPDR
ncbi:MAG: J domain-containing protein [Chloroflexi bacterium]|nr:J domain-containing protein [Chloroflexota bacterium]